MLALTSLGRCGSLGGVRPRSLVFFFCSLFNDVVGVSFYVSSDDRMIDELNDLEEIGLGLIEILSRNFFLRD
jgi:hypothetical protein